jgi:hypothetical protein
MWSSAGIFVADINEKMSEKKINIHLRTLSHNGIINVHIYITLTIDILCKHTLWHAAPSYR